MSEPKIDKIAQDNLTQVGAQRDLEGIKKVFLNQVPLKLTDGISISSQLKEGERAANQTGFSQNVQKEEGVDNPEIELAKLAKEQEKKEAEAKQTQLSNAPFDQAGFDNTPLGQMYKAQWDQSQQMQAQSMYQQIMFDRQKWQLEYYKTIQNFQTEYYKAIQEVILNRIKFMNSSWDSWREAILGGK